MVVAVETAQMAKVRVRDGEVSLNRVVGGELLNVSVS